ncbi:MAG: hypothetical protein HN348_23610 [Proteobacteria bacterium]|jgi:hypothetical protein|nr:hypothetical protein [Pseudomonadota bacterium]
MFRFGRSCFLAAILVLGATSCGPAQGPPGPEMVELRSYKVPEAKKGQLVDMLNDSLRGGEETAPRGRASEGPGGELILVATPHIHHGVQEMLSTLEVSPVSPPKNLLLTYYVVTEDPQGGDDPRLVSIEKALETIRQTDGVETFRLDALRSLLSMDGKSADLSGGGWTFEQWASYSPEDDTFKVAIGVNYTFFNLNTQVQLAPGQLLVLARNVDGNDALSYVIVKAEIADSAP